MSLPVDWLDDAVDDLDRIIDYIELESPRGALAIALAVRGQADSLLGDNPRIGRTGRIKGTRELVMARTPYIVIYKLSIARVQILRILHGAQQWPPRSGV